MKHYHAYIDGKQVGPLTIDELKSIDLKADTLVWHAGLTEWIHAKNVAELREYFEKQVSPPPIHSATNQKSTITIKQWYAKQHKGKFYTISGALCLLLVLFIGVLRSNSNRSSANLSESDYVLIDTTKARKLEEDKRLREIDIEEQANKKLIEVKEKEEREKNKAELRRLQSEQTTVKEKMSLLYGDISEYESRLEDAGHQLERVREWQFGRLRSEREAQENKVLRKIATLQYAHAQVIAEQEMLETKLTEINKRINELSLRIQNNITYSN